MVYFTIYSTSSVQPKDKVPNHPFMGMQAANACAHGALHDMLARIDHHFKAEQGARRAAERKLAEAVGARMALQDRLAAEATANAEQAAALAATQVTLQV